jgi:hypothetical protein
VPPEKVVILEVAMVRFIRPELDHSLEALDERVTKLERDGVRVVAPAEPPSGGASPDRRHGDYTLGARATTCARRRNRRHPREPRT